MARDTPIPSEGSGSGASFGKGEDGDLPADDLERLADLDDRLGGHVSGDRARPDGDTPAADDPPEGLDAILLLRQMAAEEQGDDAGDDQEFPRRIGRFAVVREVGRGGFAVVYEAVDTRLLRRVALKVARPEAVLPRGARRRFVREAELAARLVHPNVVTIHEAGEADGRVYIAEEFCAGGNLGEWLERHPGPLPPRVAARVVLALAGAVAHSHGFCILHRDIKPANVLLVPGESGPLGDAGRGRVDVKLADFGLGKLADPDAEPGDASDLTRAGARLGTPAWMAPEQIDRSFGTVGPATDIHALGLLLDRLLTGRCAHAGGDDAETMRLVLTAEAVPADRIVPGVPADLGAVTAKCLAKHAVDRYATVADLAGDLSRFLDGRPTVARPVTAFAHALCFARRHRGLVAASAVAVAATLVASVAVWLGNLERRHSALRTAEVRGHQAAATLRRGVESWRTGDVLGALGQLAACRDLDPQLAESLAGRWLRARLHGEEAILLAPDGPAGDRPLDLHALAVSPDGSHVAVGGADGTVTLVRNEGGAVYRVKVDDEINDIAFSPGGERLATAGEGGRVCVIDSLSGAMLAEIQGNDGPLFGVAWAPDGRSLVCGGAAREVRILDIDGADAPPVVLRPFDGLHPPPGKNVEIECLAFVGGNRLAVACGNLVVIIDARTGHIVHQSPGHSGTVTHLAVSPDGRSILSGGSDCQPRVWDASSGSLVAALPIHPSWVMGCAFSHDGASVVTGCRDGVVRVHPIAGGQGVSLVGHVDRVWDVAVRPDGAIVSSGADGTVRLWDPRRTLERSGVRVLVPDCAGVARAVPVGDSSLLVASRRTRSLVRIGADGASIDRGESPVAVSELALGPGRDRAAMSGPTYEIVTASMPGSAGSFHRLPDDVRSRAFVWSDTARLLVGDNTGRLIAWDDRTSRAELIDAFGVNIDALACTFAGQPRLAVCVGKAVWLYQLSADGTPRSSARRVVDLPVHNGTVRVVAWSPDGASFAIGTNTGEVERFDAQSGLPLGSFARHGREVIGLAWSPEGRTLLSADGECVRLSDVRTTTVFDELRPGFPIESVRLDVRAGEPVTLVVAGNANDTDDDAGRIALLDLHVGR